MAKLTIISEDEFGTTQTFQQDFGERCVTVSDYFEVCVGAYAAQTYCNEIDVNIYGVSGEVVENIHWDRDNGISISDEMDAFTDILLWMNDQMFEGGGDKFYMGHQY